MHDIHYNILHPTFHWLSRYWFGYAFSYAGGSPEKAFCCLGSSNGLLPCKLQLLSRFSCISHHSLHFQIVTGSQISIRAFPWVPCHVVRPILLFKSFSYWSTFVNELVEESARFPRVFIRPWCLYILCPEPHHYKYLSIFFISGNLLQSYSTPPGYNLHH